MTTLIPSAADEPEETGEVALRKELPLRKLERDLERPLPKTRGVNYGCIAAAAAGDAPDPAAYVERFHGEQFDADVADHVPASRRGLVVLKDYGQRASAKLAALRKELRGMDRYEKVPSDASAWTGFERFRVAFLALLSLVLLAFSIQQLAQLLVTGGYTATLLEGLRYAFVPLVAVAGLEIVGQQLVVGEKAQRNYARLLAAVCIGAALIWAHGYTSLYGTTMNASQDVDLDSLLGIGDASAGAVRSSADTGLADGTFILLASVVAEVFGAALIWLVLFSEFEEHAPWRRSVSRAYRDTSAEIEALSLAASNAARLEGRYQGRVDLFEHGRRDLINEARKALHEAQGDRKRTTDMVRRLREEDAPSASPRPRFDRNRLNEPSHNGERHDD